MIEIAVLKNLLQISKKEVPQSVFLSEGEGSWQAIQAMPFFYAGSFFGGASQ